MEKVYDDFNEKIDLMIKYIEECQRDIRNFVDTSPKEQLKSKENLNKHMLSLYRDKILNTNTFEEIKVKAEKMMLEALK